MTTRRKLLSLLGGAAAALVVGVPKKLGFKDRAIMAPSRVGKSFVAYTPPPSQKRFHQPDNPRTIHFGTINWLTGPKAGTRELI